MSAEAEADTEKRRSPLLISILIFGVLALLVVLASRFYTDYLWFSSVSASTVFTTQLAARVGLFLGFGLLMGGGLFGSLVLAYRLRPPVRRANLDSELLLQLRDSLDKRSRTLMLLPSVVAGLLGGGVAASQSQTFLAWTRATEFGTPDAVFGLDASFYVFQLPWWRFVLSYVSFMVVVCLVGSLLVHFLTGAMNSTAFRKTGNLKAAGRAAQRQVSILLGVALLFYGVASFLDRYGYLTTQNNLFTGVNYTDATSRIPASLIVAAIAGICALLCFYNAWRVRWSVPGIAVGLLVISAMILTAVYPWGVRNFVVKPNEPDLERPWIANNIEATRGAFGINAVQITDYEAVDSVSAGQLRTDAAALPAIRLMDPAIIAPTFEQLQQVRGYYRFPKPLDVDRYNVDGKETDSVVAARELDLNAVEAGNTWNNMHTVYTHGYGLVAAYGNRRESNGEPTYFSGGIPTEGLIKQEQPRIYFGEESKHWVIAGAPEGAEPVELDTPGGGQEHTETKYTYQGSGGVPVGNFLNKAAFAVRFGDINLLLSERVNSNSRLLFNRVPVDRVKEVAPFLTVDSDAYPTVVNGRIVWIIDAYTTTADYPNSTRVDWTQATKDTRTSGDRTSSGTQVNYVRNSVKATVDAYDGTVTLYGWDESDPILQTWSKVYPGLITPKSEISPELMAHLRPSFPDAKGDMKLLNMPHVIEIVMLTAGAFIILCCKPNSTAITRGSVFHAGMRAVMAIFGIAWMSDTYFNYAMPVFKESVTAMVQERPWTFAFALFAVSVLINSQAATAKILLPVGIGLGIPAPTLIGLMPATYAYFFIPNYPSDIATINFDVTGTTKIGKWYFNHSFMAPGLVGVVVACLVGLALAKVIIVPGA